MPRTRSPLPPPALAGIAASFQAMRKQKKMTQAELAERSGQSQTYISAIERGTRDVRATTLAALAAALGCELVLIPKDRAPEARHLAGRTPKPTLPATVFEEVYVPDPSDADGD